MAEVKVDEVFGLYVASFSSAIGEAQISQTKGHHDRGDTVEGCVGDREGKHSIPCVTKLPKFRPTMQCQVGPFLSSNYEDLGVSQRARNYFGRGRGRGRVM